MANFCTNCGKEFDGEPNFCPFCGSQICLDNDSSKSNTVKKNKPLNAGCGCLLGVIVFFVFINILFGDSSNTTTDLLTGSDALRVVDSKSCRGDYGTKMICGTIRNESSKTFGYAQVEINLYDKSGNLIGSTLSNINNFSPQSNWKFEAPVLEENYASYEIKDVTGY